LVAKPCKQQEVDFYQSSVQHPEFRKYMPMFFGTLSTAPQGSDPASAGIAGPAQKLLDAQIALTSTTASSSTTDTPIAAELALAPPASIQQPQWVPSGGRKLNTGISVVLENVASGFTRPNVMDVKLGARLWADDAHPDKRARLDKVSSETTSCHLGFRIAGMKLSVPEYEVRKEVEQTMAAQRDQESSSKMKVVETDGYRHYDKWYGRTFNQHNVKEAFETFLAGAKIGRKDRSKMVAARLAAELRAIQAMLEAEESRMYSASALFVYEGDPDAFEHALIEEERQEKEEAENPTLDSESDEEPANVYKRIEGEVNLEEEPELELGAEAATLEELEEDEEEPPKVHDVRLIDFAHASWTPGQGPDENALQGIRSLARIMEDLAS
jgi:1D-myo-inositol-tetrakisphosphate 5-kinase/inositol-polyphosphate multikinase